MNEQGFYLPPLYKRVCYRILRLRARGEHAKYVVPPLPYKDSIAFYVGTKLDLADRLRCLFGATIEFQIVVDTREVTSNDRRIRHSLILKP